MSAENPLSFIGIDVGGTNVSGALADDAGRISEREKQRTPRGGGPDDVLGVIADVIDALLSGAGKADAAVAAIGLGVPGLVDPDEGLVAIAPNVGSGLKDVQLVDPLEKKFGLPVFLGNDVNVGMMGEVWLGAARGVKSAVGMFVGTGIGGGIVSDGKLVHGVNHAAGEIGHMIMQIDGPLCGCGNRGCLEALAGRRAIERDLREAVEAGRETVLTDILDGDLGSIRSKALRKALKKKDALVTEIMERAGCALGLACISLQHILQPEVIVLGGGVIEACSGFLMPIIEKTFSADPLSLPGAGGRLAVSALGDDAGVLGAVALARAQLLNGDNGGNGAGNGGRIPEYPEVELGPKGSVRVGGKSYDTDVYVRCDGRVKKRKKAVIKKKFGTSHVIGREEVRKLCKGRPELLIIGTGHEGIAGLDESAERFLQDQKLPFKLLHSPNAVAEYARFKGRKALLLHVKC